MKRHEFFSIIGISAATVAFAPFLTACSKSSGVAADPVVPPASGVDFTIDLSVAANAALLTNGGSLIKNNVIVAKTSAGTYAAVGSSCTHEGAAIQFDNANTRFICSNQSAGHASKFSTSGAVTAGPAGSALKMYSTALTGTSLRIYG
ncbi:MAG: Rieske 2Fe-2S domain-containing protein [Mariniphaga sp.]